MERFLTCLVLSSVILAVAPSSFEECWSGTQDIVMIIDGSGSIGTNNYRLVKNYIKDYISKTSVDDGKVRIGIVLFSYTSEVIFKMNTFDKASDMLEVVENMHYPRSVTNTAAGLRLAREELFVEKDGDRPDVPNIALLIVDGNSNRDREDTIPEATLLKETGARVVAVSIGNSAKAELDKMASLPLSENRIDVENFDLLPSIVPNTLKASCVACLNFPVDLAFLIDSSFSVGQYNFEHIIDYVVSVVNLADTSNGNVKVAALTYSTHATVRHSFTSKSSSTESLLSSLATIPYVPGWSNLAAGLRTTRTEVFSSKGGDRPEVLNVALLITDGRYNIFSEETVEEAKLLRQEGVYVLMVGVGMESPETAKDVVTHPVKEHSFTVSTFENLVGFSEVLFPFFCEEQGPPPNDTTTTTSTIEPTTTTSTTTVTTTTTISPETTSTAEQITTEETFNGTTEMTINGSTEVTSIFSTTLTLTRTDQCHAWCEDKDTKDPDNSFEETIKGLLLPKNQMSKQRRAKQSVLDEGGEAMGGVFSFLFFLPFLFFVGWDLLDAIRFLSGNYRKGGGY